MKSVYTLSDLQNWQTATGDIEPPIRLAVVGDPVAHSASPPMHNAALQACGIAAQYGRLHIRPDELAEAFQLLPKQGFIGVNCTIPHKANALKLVNEPDDHARRIGVVNTVVVDGEKLRGFNTDGPGLVRALHAEFSVELRDLRVMILGASGGAGRAIAMQCGIEACQGLVLVNRTQEKAAELQSELAETFPKMGPVRAAAWDDTILRKEIADIDLIINCTPVGMKPGDSSPLPSSILRPEVLVYDTIYTSHRTQLMLAADAAGARSANGKSMLLHQGVLSFEIWFQRPAPVEDMQAGLDSASA